MSALHRLKAYFGMVPAHEFDTGEFDRGEFQEEYERAGFAGHPLGEAGPGSPREQHAQRPSTPLHPSRPPSCAPQSWASPSRSGASVSGSLAIDPAAASSPPTRQPTTCASRPGLFADPLTPDPAHPLSRIVTLHPHTYSEARPIGERYREGNPVIMNLTAMQDRDAKRLVDFAAGLAFALRGSIDKVTNKVFLLSPPNVDVSAEDRRRIAEGGFFS